LPLQLFGARLSIRRKASRAPQAQAAEEAPLSERSEFGRRAAGGEERRAPMRLHRIGECQAKAVWFLCQDKRNSRKARKHLILYLLSRQAARNSGSENEEAKQGDSIKSA